MAGRKNDGISRVERAAMAAALLERGFTRTEIGVKLGVSRNYVSALLIDPDGAKDHERKLKYYGTCTECGGKTSYGRKVDAPRRRCIDCQRKHVHETRKWTPETIIESIQRWNEIYGEPPKATQWLIEIKGDGTKNSREWPHVNVVQREFGSWSNAIEAAGFKRRINYERTAEWRAKKTKWPKDLILEKMREWHAEYGVAPRQHDWDSNRPAGYPSATTVMKKFKNWHAAVMEAGLHPYVHSRRKLALAEWDHQLLRMPGENGNKLPSFTERGEGKSLMEVVNDLPERRKVHGHGHD